MSTLRIRYSTIEFKRFDIHVRTLRDNQQFADPHGEALKLGISSATWPYFGIIWKSGTYLAFLMEDYPIRGKRILEIGCGVGLASLVLNHRGADITATDYHPEANSFLDKNTSLNEDPAISFIQTDWQELASTSLGFFDLLIGSDLLYERTHPEKLATFINQHAQPHCTVIIVDPGRGYISKFTKHMNDFGFGRSPNQIPAVEVNPDEFTGSALCFSRASERDV